MTLHKDGSSAVLNIALEKEGEKKRLLQHGYSYLVTQPSTNPAEQGLKGEFHGSAHARILTGLCALSGTGPGFSLFMNQSWASYLILQANSPKIINRRIYLLGQQMNSTVHCVGNIC